MDAIKRYFAEYNITQDKGIQFMKNWLFENNYDYCEKDNRFNETMLEIFNGDVKVGEGRVRDYIPRIRLENQNEHLYIGQEIKVTEQEINNLYGRQVFYR